MSIKSIAWAFDVDLPPTDKLVLITLCDHHNDETGRCDPSMQRIVKRAGVSKATALRALKRLSDKGEGALHRKY